MIKLSKARPPSKRAPSPPVDLKCLENVVSGDEGSAAALIDSFIQTTTDILKQIDAAVRAGVADRVELLAHSCIGCSTLLGMNAIVPPLRELERLGREGNLALAGKFLTQSGKEFERIKSFLKEENGWGNSKSSRR